MKQAGLLKAPSRAHFQITEHGLQILKTQVGDIGIIQLKDLIDPEGDQIPLKGEDVAVVEDTNGVTPDEQMAVLHVEMNEKLADELLDSVRNVPPDRFERLMVRLLEKMGYRRGQIIGRPGDEGIDGIIDQDLLGLEKVYIQAKRWQNRVGGPEIRNFSGSL